MAYTTINKSTDNFRIKLYAGNASNRSITFDESTNMQPDLVWIKSRTNAEWHHWVDAVRGTTSNIYSNATNSADTDTDRVTAFGTIGFLFSGNYLNANLPLSIGFLNIPAFLIFFPITAFMARLGAQASHRINKKKMTKYFGLFLIIIGTKFLYEYFNI